MSRPFATVCSVGLAACFLSTGCFSVKYYVENSASPVEATSGPGKFRYHFKEDGRSYFMVGGLVPIWSDRMDSTLAGHMIPGSRISNLKITHQLGLIDVLGSIGASLVLGWVFGAILGPTGGYVAAAILPGSRTITYEGDVVGGEATP